MCARFNTLYMWPVWVWTYHITYTYKPKHRAARNSTDFTITKVQNIFRDSPVISCVCFELILEMLVQVFGLCFYEIELGFSFGNLLVPAWYVTYFFLYRELHLIKLILLWFDPHWTGHNIRQLLAESQPPALTPQSKFLSDILLESTQKVG